MSARAGLLFAAALALSAPAVEAVQCHFELDGSARSADNGDLIFVRNGTEVARISDAAELTLAGEPVVTTPEQRALLVDYRDTHAAIIAEAKQVGLAGAKLGGKAAYSMVVGLLTGTADRVEANIEAEAAALEARADALCVFVHEMRAHHEALSAAIPAFGEAIPVQ